MTISRAGLGAAVCGVEGDSNIQGGLYICNDMSHRERLCLTSTISTLCSSCVFETVQWSHSLRFDIDVAVMYNLFYSGII